MRIRKGFVSNSSSSSFICDVCGRTESGWDLGLVDAGMMRCVNDHVFCEGHSAELTIERMHIALTDILESSRDKSWRRELIEELEPKIEELDPGSELYSRDVELLWEDYEDQIEWPYEVPSTVCPICNFEAANTREVYEYLLKKTGETEEDVLKELKQMFENYDKLKEYIECG